MQGHGDRGRHLSKARSGFGMKEAPEDVTRGNYGQCF